MVHYTNLRSKEGFRRDRARPCPSAGAGPFHAHRLRVPSGQGRALSLRLKIVPLMASWYYTTGSDVAILG